MQRGGSSEVKRVDLTWLRSLGSVRMGTCTGSTAALVSVGLRAGALLSRSRDSAATAWVLCSRPRLLYRLSCKGGEGGR